jgi:hypothetical protein
MVGALKKEKYVHAFLIFLKGEHARIDQNLQDMLYLFKNIFGDAFIENMAFVFTHWS